MTPVEQPANQPSLNDLLRHADDAYHTLDLEAARALYQQAAELDPASYEAHLGAARTFTRMRLHGEALEACGRCIDLDPTRFEAYAARSTLHFLADELDEAEEQARAALDRADHAHESWLTLAQIYCDRRDFTRADEYIAEARQRIEALPAGRERDELTAMAWHVQTYRHLLANEADAAREAAERVIEMEDASPYAAALAYSNLGIMETRARHYDQAIGYLERAYSTNPHFYRAAGALGRVLIMRGQHARAAEVLEQVVGRDGSDNGEARYALAVALAKSGRRSEARDQYRQALGEGLKGFSRIMAWWQMVWLQDAVRYALFGLCAAAFVLWVVAGQPSQQAITLVVMVGMLIILQRVFPRRS